MRVLSLRAELCTHRDVDGPRQASCADPGMHLAQLLLLLLSETGLVFLHAPQGLTVLSQHSLHVPVIRAQGKKVNEIQPSSQFVYLLDGRCWNSSDVQALSSVYLPVFSFS